MTWAVAAWLAAPRGTTANELTHTSTRLAELPAGVVELADTQDLGSCAFGREGSSPFSGTAEQGYDKHGRRVREAPAEIKGSEVSGSRRAPASRCGERSGHPGE